MHRVWVAALILLAVVLVARQWTANRTPGEKERVGPSSKLIGLARWTLMLRELEIMSEQFGMAADSIDALKKIQQGDADRLRRSILTAEVRDAKAALEVIDTIHANEPGREVLRRRYSAEAITSEEQADLEVRHGWFGRLSAIYGLSKDDPARVAFLAPFVRAAKLFFVVPVVTFSIFMAGVVLLFLFVKRCIKGEMVMRFLLRDEGAGDLPWLQIVVLFLGLAVLASRGLFAWLGVPAIATMWILALPIFWPLLRGVSRREWMGSLGLVGGWREVGAGLIGYMAGLPVIALGFWMTTVLVRMTGIPADHPMQNEFGRGSTWMILMGAVVWAPLVEELVFRGAFYRYLRPSFTVVGSTLLSAFLFAVLHPQGLTGIPALMSIGIVLAVIREWRGSTIATMTMHAVHNGALVTLMLTMFSD